MAAHDKRAKQGIDGDFDFPETDGVTVLVPVPVASYCYLFEALLWVSFLRFPLFAESEDGLDIRIHNTNWDSTYPRVETEPVSDEECRSVGLPLSPEYAVYIAGDYVSDPEHLEQIQLLIPDSDEGKKLEAELAASRKHYAEREVWEQHFDQFLDLHKSRLFVALREGKILSVGKRLPSGANNSFPDEASDEDWDAWCDRGWSRIPATNWLSSGIDWETSVATGASEAHASILLSTTQLMTTFPAEAQPTDQVVRIGSAYQLGVQGGQRHSTNRGRPAFAWDEFHLELAKRLTSTVLPEKQEALVADMQQWCLEKWARKVGRSTLVGKIAPYYREIIRKSQIPT